MAINGNIRVGIGITEKTSPTAIETPVSRTITVGPTDIGIADGTSDFQAKFIWSARGVLTATTITFDLTALPVPNVAGFGTGSPIITLTKVKGIYVFSESSTDGQILYLGNAATNPWSACFDTATNRQLIMPGSPFFASNLYAQGTNPWTVDSTHKNIKLDSLTATITYRIVIFGI
jgi:hypothetical protein